MVRQEERIGRLRQSVIDKITLDSDENILGILGTTFLGNFARVGTRGFGKSIMLLTDRRLYLVGKVYMLSEGRRILYSRVRGRQTIASKDIISAAMFEEQPAFFQAILGLIFMVGGAVTAIISNEDYDQNGVAAGAVIFLVGFFAWLINFLRTKKTFRIEHGGGHLTTDCRWFSDTEIREFERAIFETGRGARTIPKTDQDA